MAMMIVRVELRGTPTGEDYYRLHAAMRRQGFSQTITGTTGTYNLPHAMYCSVAYVHASAATNAAMAAATSVWTKVAVVASGSDWDAIGLTSA